MYNNLGESVTYRCKFYSKSGYERCCKQLKCLYPDNDTSALLFESLVDHVHNKKNDNQGDNSKFTCNNYYFYLLIF